MNIKPPPCPFRIGAWDINPSANEFVREGEAVRVEPKVMQVLLALAERPGEVVSRDDLLKQVWQDVVVTEDALSTTISKLRRVLHDDARDPRYVETVPKTGYRLIASVVQTEPPSLPGSRPLVRSLQQPRWIRVLAVAGAAFILLTVIWLAWRPPVPSVPTFSPLTTAAGSEQYPALAPDGQSVAYVARARDTHQHDLYVQALDGGSPRRLTDDGRNDLHPAWAPDGQSLAFLRCEGFQCRVYTVSVLGGAPRRRAEAPVAPYGLAWTLDGQHLIVLVRADPDTPYRLHLLDLKTGATQPLTDPPAGADGDFNPIVSPDGETLAFVRYKGGSQALFRMTLPDGIPVCLVAQEGLMRGIAWTPDGTLLVSATWEGTNGLWRVPLGNDAPERIAGPVPSMPGALAVADGRLVVEDWTTEVNLWAAEQMEDGWQPLRAAVTSTAADWQPALSPDGTRVAFISERSGSRELWVAHRDGSHPLRLTHFGGPSVGVPAWAPNGQWIAFEVHRQGQSNLYTIAAEGGHPQPLTSARAYDHTPRFSHDGRWVYFGSDRSGDAQIWKVPADGSEPLPVTTQGGYTAAESADGSRLYFTKHWQSGLWMRPVDGGPEERLLETLSPLDWGNWVVTTAGLYYLDRTGERTRLMRLDPQTGTTEILFEVDDVPTREVALTATPDGRVVTLTRTDRLESDLVLIEPLPQ